MARPKDLGLAYLRRSTDRQAISMPSQLEWARKAAHEHQIPLNDCLADLEYMQASGMHSYKSIRLDDGVSGFDLKRPGFLAVNQDANTNKRVSHVFIYKRDRFARPEDALEAAMIEKKLLMNGITVVFSDVVSLPINVREPHRMRDIELVMAYSQSGEELQKHAERIIKAQKMLAEAGFRTGGNPPYGFARVLVNEKNEVIQELPPGMTARIRACHVRWVPKDREKIAIWLMMLDWKHQGFGIKWIARQLNSMNIPSPSAGKKRRDHGTEHFVSGKWHHNTVAELCRNATILGMQEHGKRSEGILRRLGPDGPRLLDDEKDYSEEKDYPGEKDDSGEKNYA